MTIIFLFIITLNNNNKNILFIYLFKIILNNNNKYIIIDLIKLNENIK